MTLPTDRQAGDPTEIEITPQMIKAGVEVFLIASLASEPLDAAQEVVEDVFRAMLKAATVSQSSAAQPS
ncbi:hypothetical protein ACFOOP_15055 [Marinicaulis aureus]|uniref:Uncharacterized protein n=1 Tax=Hyphococcus aureus TaxID=2666033 RepID=A0ABW1KZK4_9PROT